MIFAQESLVTSPMVGSLFLLVASRNIERYKKEISLSDDD